MSVPFLLLGDAPDRPTGLGRIARDLARLFHANQERLGIVVGQMGYGGSALEPARLPWPTYGTNDVETWGAEDLPAVWARFAGDEPGVLFTVWDPARCFETVHLSLPVQRWGYFAIDSHNAGGGISGPAGEAVHHYDRVLGYGRWGSQILRSASRGPVGYLPHGIDLETFRPNFIGPYTDAWNASTDILGRTVKDTSILVGAVATNQARKDLGLLFAAVALMREQDRRIRLWLHIDKDINYWSVPQLAHDFNLGSALVVTHDLEDETLAALYSRCAMTIAPGLGEGFCYPIVESLACGTPVVHGDFAGGRELVPCNAWRFPVRATRFDGGYALVRPVFDPQDVANAAWRAIRWAQEEPVIVREYCRGAVAHLDWRQLGPRWLSWVQQGIREFNDE